MRHNFAYFSSLKSSGRVITSLVLLLLILVSYFAISSTIIVHAQSLVSTTTDSNSVDYVHQHKSFHAAGLFWAFYCSGSSAVFRTSADGSSWSAATSIGSCNNGYELSIDFDGAHVHYIRYYSYDLYYRSGTPETDGTITWLDDEQKAFDGAYRNTIFYPMIAIDSSGYAWIGGDYQSDSTTYRPNVIKNQYNNGTWLTESGFPYELTTVSDSTWLVQMIPLTTQKVYAIYAYTSSSSGMLPLGKLYNSGWGSQETTLTDYAIQSGYGFSATAQGDNIHLTYLRFGTYQIRYNIRTYGVGWGASDLLVQNSVDVYSAPALSLDTYSDDLYCFWMSGDTDHVYYNYYNGSWNAAIDWIDESADMVNAHILSSFPQSYDGYIGLIYATKTSSPYNVKFAYLTVSAPPTGYQLNLKVMDWDLTDAVSGAKVTVNNGTSNVKISDASGWANYTGVSGSITVTVHYFSFLVNSTSLSISSDTTLSLKCKLYDVIVKVQASVSVGVLSGANITVYNSTTQQANKITTTFTNSTGYIRLSNLPNNTLTFTVYDRLGASSHILVNTTDSITADEQTVTLTITDNFSSVQIPNIYIFSYASVIILKRKKKKEVE
jgi:hypothetical protein